VSEWSTGRSPRDTFRLNLGCGSRSLEGWVNVDAVAQPGVDVAWNLDALPWPFRSGHVSEIRAYDVFEHVDDPLGFMAECWRVMEEYAPLAIHTSYWKSENSFTDPTHKRFCTERTFDYWIPGTPYYDRYAASYARGARFRREHTVVDGQELDVLLRKLPAA
jgi:hypothetical protein